MRANEPRVKSRIRRSGIDVLGDVPWGTHFCQFYQNKDDLLAMLVPYFKAGLESNEFCVWVTSDPLDPDEALAALAQTMPGIDNYLRSGCIEIVRHTDWYLKGGQFDAKRVLDSWTDKLDHALVHGFDGLRVSGNTAWLEKSEWRDFTEYEEAINAVIGQRPIIVLCTYALEKCGASEVIDVVRNHEFAMIMREGAWDVIKSSEGRRAEEALRASETKYRIVADNTYDWELWLDADGKLVYCSPSCERITGYTRAEFEADDSLIYRIVHPEDLSRYMRHRLEVERGVATSQLEFRIIRRDGTVRWIEHRCQPVFDDHGYFAGNRGGNHDVTERKLAEEQLRRTRDFLENLIGCANAPIIVWDPAFRITQFNRAFERITGYSADEVIGKELTILFPEGSREESLREIHRTLTGDYWESVEIPILRKDGGTRLALWNSANIYAEDGKTLLATVAQGQDITERKRVQEELRRQTEELQAANRELESFSYSVSHDLRAPLRAMDGFSRILLQDYEPLLPEEAQRYLHLVRDSAQQMGRLIDDLLTFSRLSRQPMKRQSVVPDVIVQQVLNDLRHEQDGRKIEIVVGDIPVLSADPALLKQVYTNLLSNALKFTRQREVALIEVGCYRQGDEDIHFVKDNGVGFDMRYADQLFGVFQRLHRAEDYEGTGVGLAIVQRILHRHGGRIWAEAAVDRGATFYFTVGEGDTCD